MQVPPNPIMLSIEPRMVIVFLALCQTTYLQVKRRYPVLKTSVRIRHAYLIMHLGFIGV